MWWSCASSTDACAPQAGLLPWSGAPRHEPRSTQLHARISATPTAVVTSVIGAPIRRNAQNPIRACARAVSNTITFATEPKRVRFPAKVEVRASSSHSRWESAPCPTHRAAASTYGTLETRFDASTDTQAKWAMPRRPGAWNHGTTQVETTVRTPAASRPAMMIGVHPPAP
jgi:hypothetical protein